MIVVSDGLHPFVSSICETKYADVDKPVILDKARGWASEVNMPTMYNVLGYKPKIIATVRNVEDCVASMVRVAVARVLFSSRRIRLCFE